MVRNEGQWGSALDSKGNSPDNPRKGCTREWTADTGSEPEREEVWTTIGARSNQRQGPDAGGISGKQTKSSF